MLYKLKLKKGRSYTSSDKKIVATKDKPFCVVDDKELYQRAIDSGYFESVESTQTTIEDDDSGLPTFNRDNDDNQNGNELQGGNENNNAKETNGTGNNDDEGQDRGKEHGSLEEMSVSKLKIYAEKNEIDVTGLKSKEEIKAKILESTQTTIEDDDSGLPPDFVD